MLEEVLIPEVIGMRNTGDSNRPLRWILLANAGVAVVTSGAALVVLLIAPLGMAAVLSCTAVVAVLSFALGLVADLWLWHGLSIGLNRSGFSADAGWEGSRGPRGLPPSARPGNLSTRR